MSGVINAIGSVLVEYASVEKDRSKRVEKNLLKSQGCKAHRSDIMRLETDDDAPFGNSAALNDSLG